MVHDGGHLGKQPAVGKVVRGEGVLRQRMVFAEAGPAAEEHASLTGQLKRLQDEPQGGVCVAAGHTPKANRDRRWGRSGGIQVELPPVATRGGGRGTKTRDPPSLRAIPRAL